MRSSRQAITMGKYNTKVIDIGLFMQIWAYSGIFRHIQAYSDIFKNSSDIFRHIQNPV